jgi:signal transduction histidine kinase
MKQSSGGRNGGAAGPERLAVRQIVAESAADLACALLQATDYGILMTDREGRDLVGNRRFGELFGVDVSGIVEMDREQVRSAMRARLKDPDDFFERVDSIYRTPEWEGEEEVEIIWPEPRILRRFTAPVRDTSGGAVGRIWTFLDVTETRRLQAQLARAAAALEAQVQERTRDLRSTTGVLQAVTQVVRGVSRARSLPELVRQAAEELRPLFGHHCAAVLLWDEHGREFRGAFAPPPAAGPTEELVLPSGQEPELERAVAEILPHQPAHLREYRSTGSSPLFQRGCGAGRLVPLVIEGKVRGLVLWGGAGQATGDGRQVTEEATGDRRQATAGQDHGSPALSSAAPAVACRLSPGELQEEQIESVVALVSIALETHMLHQQLGETLEQLCEAQAQLVQTERVAAAATLATSVAHDIRNIITPLTVELSLVAGETSEAFQAAREQMHRLSVLTQRLLAIARPTRIARDHVCLVELLRRLEPLLRTQAELENCHLSWQLETRQADIEADDSQIEQVILNLAMNSIQAMAPQGGELVISLKHSGDVVRLAVRDRGVGVPPEAREAIFRPFYTTKRSGTGLGLYSCRRIAEEHRGCIEVESPNPDGGGATFTLVLPAAGPPG